MKTHNVRSKFKVKPGWTPIVKLRGLMAAGYEAERRQRLIKLSSFQAYNSNR